ncbi:hypothetical protein [Corallincola spongiicola]|uniref:Uncharacterized protein n=1 Tax=Corallincola spongiicola TaxID=2520508 RepID=A0ABY1WT36_9GAMM|nr:hypothetical protein [Corallincola spongiicola]TAA47746.1 hypothetical protein EXY25_00405 [Corallincola spongiicola]
MRKSVISTCLTVVLMSTSISAWAVETAPLEPSVADTLNLERLFYANDQEEICTEDAVAVLTAQLKAELFSASDLLTAAINVCGSLANELALTAIKHSSMEELDSVLATAFDMATPDAYQTLYDTAYNRGLDEASLITAAILGGVDPTALAPVTAAGDASDNLTPLSTPANLGVGGGGGGGGSISAN